MKSIFKESIENFFKSKLAHFDIMSEMASHFRERLEHFLRLKNYTSAAKSLNDMPACEYKTLMLKRVTEEELLELKMLQIKENKTITHIALYGTHIFENQSAYHVMTVDQIKQMHRICNSILNEQTGKENDDFE